MIVLYPTQDCNREKLRNRFFERPYTKGTDVCAQHVEGKLSRKGLQREDVIRAYVALLRQRREPSLCNIRLELGRGSYSTIAAHLEALCLVRYGRRYRRTGVQGRPRGSGAPVLKSPTPNPLGEG
jgi:hypothetical protein